MSESPRARAMIISGTAAVVCGILSGAILAMRAPGAGATTTAPATATAAPAPAPAPAPEAMADEPAAHDPAPDEVTDPVDERGGAAPSATPSSSASAAPSASVVAPPSASASAPPPPRKAPPPPRKSPVLGF